MSERNREQRTGMGMGMAAGTRRKGDDIAERLEMLALGVLDDVLPRLERRWASRHVAQQLTRSPSSPPQPAPQEPSLRDDTPIPIPIPVLCCVFLEPARLLPASCPPRFSTPS